MIRTALSQQKNPFRDYNIFKENWLIDIKDEI